MSKAKKSQKMLRWMKMDSNELKWAKWIDLESLLSLQWTTPREDLLWDFFWTWEVKEDGRIQGEYVVKRVLLILYLFMSNLECPKFKRSSRCYKCNFWRSQKRFEKDYRSTCLCWKWIMECSMHERGISCKICNYFVIFLSKIKVSLCCNLNIRFTTKCEVQGPMRPRMCLGVEHTLTNGGKCKGWRSWRSWNIDA
jgi:hypothetical protein